MYRKIKPDVEIIVNAQKRKRLVLERKDVVKLCYTEYSKTLKPEQFSKIHSSMISFLLELMLLERFQRKTRWLVFLSSL